METLAKRLALRQQNYPEQVIFLGEGTLDEDAVIEDIEVLSRGSGGTVEELKFFTNQGEVLVRRESHVRHILTDGESSVQLQDGGSYACGNLLPSAFFYVDTIMEEGRLAGIALVGGGFGHGVGMSQNGAKRLANRGYGAAEILAYYYQGCEVK